MDSESDEEASRPGPAEPEREAAISALKGDQPKWEPPDGVLDLNGVRWKPDLVQPGKRVLHLALTPSIPRVWLRRMHAAVAAGYSVTFATATTDLPLATLLEVQRADAHVAHVDLARTPPRVVSYRSVADLVSKAHLYLEPDAIRVLAGERLGSALSAPTSSSKGRWYEEVLCLVFSQVAWLTVDEHAYRNASEEIDLLIACHAIGHVASLVGGPIVVATAKNEDHATGSQTVKYLKEQMANRKGRCKLGFLCSASTISSNAQTEILRGTQAADAVIVPIDRSTLETLIAHPDELTSRVEALIKAAIAE